MRSIRKRIVKAAACALIVLLCAALICACAQKQDQGGDAAITPKPDTAAATPSRKPTEAPKNTPFPEPTICPGQHGGLIIVTGDDSPGEDDIKAYCHVFSESKFYPDGSGFEGDGMLFQDLYPSVSDKLPRVSVKEGLVIYPPDFPGYSRQPVESVTVYMENEDGAIEEYRVLYGTEGLLDLVETEWDGEQDLIVDYAVRFNNRYDFSDGSLGTGLEGWAFVITP